MKKIMLLAAAISAVLVSCGGGGTDTGSGTGTGGGTTAAISGKLVEGTAGYDANNLKTLTTKAWSQGAATLELVYGEGNVAANAAVLTTTPVAADGTFSVASLPTPSAAQLFSPAQGSSSGTCTGDYTNNNPNAKVAIALGRVKLSNGNYLVAYPYTVVNNMQSATAQQWSLVYADQAVTFGGAKTCKYTSNGKIYSNVTNNNFSLKSGWNILQITNQNDLSSLTSTISYSTPSTLPTEWVTSPN